MASPVTLGQLSEIEYPDSDGEPLSDNTLQLEWLFLLKGNLDVLFKDNPDVFVAGDLLWYPVQGRPDIRSAPDAMVVFGRPKGYRGSYRQWEEGGIAPQVVFEVLSLDNRPDEMTRKLQFYDTYGVEEYYLYDPDTPLLSGWRRVGPSLQLIPEAHNWISPRLKIRFDMSGPELVIFDPKGQKFLTVLEREARREKAEQQARTEQQQREQAEQRARTEQQQREQAEQRAGQAAREAKQAREQTDQERSQRQQAEERARLLADRLRQLGIDPDTLPGPALDE